MRAKHTIHREHPKKEMLFKISMVCFFHFLQIYVGDLTLQNNSNALTNSKKCIFIYFKHVYLYI